jgi:hypothetical protein
MTNPNEPAFPVGLENHDSGLTKREYIAAMAMQGLCANTGVMTQIAIACKSNPELGTRTLAGMAKMQADALIAELSEKN